MLECVPNVSEGRDLVVLDELSQACGAALLDRHHDVDHHRAVFTLADEDVGPAVRALATAVAAKIDLRAHRGVHPHVGALDVVPFVALGGTTPRDAIDAAHDFAAWAADTLGVPVFLYDGADRDGRSLPDARRDAFTTRTPDRGPRAPHARLGAIAVGARPPMVAVNCELARDDVDLARAIARQVRERDGGLPGVRALGFHLASRGRAQVSMNLVDLQRTGLPEACRAVERLARDAGTSVDRVELVGLLPAEELARCDDRFVEWSGIGPDVTIEGRLDARRRRTG